jgi:hypothetical protein
MASPAPGVADRPALRVSEIKKSFVGAERK